MNWERKFGDRRLKTYTVLEQIVQSTATLCGQFWAYRDDYQPFHDNENSAVSLLLAGAARSGFHPVSEYRLPKRSWLNGRKFVPGRADLWLIANGDAYSFEFKRTKKNATYSNIKSMMAIADRDIARIKSNEYDFAFSGLIAPKFRDEKSDIFETFAQEVDFTFLIGEPEKYLVYLYLNQHGA